MTRRILVIDENISEYKKVIDTLKSNYIVDDVGYIETARFKLRKNHYDLVVLDIMMPTLGLFDNNETSDGFRTGLVYFEHELKQLNVPVLFWSLNSAFEKEIKELKKNDSSWKKTDFLLKESDCGHLLYGVNRFFLCKTGTS